MGKRSRWQQYVDAAVVRLPGSAGSPAPAQAAPDHPPAGWQQRPGTRLRDRLPPFARPERPAPAREETPRRTDIRLVPAAVLVWAMAAAGHQLHPAALAALCLALVAAGGVQLLRVVFPAGARRTGKPARRSFHATMAVALLLAAAAGGHGAADSSRRHDGAVAAAAAAHTAVAVEVDITGAPRRLKAPGRSGLADRWAVPATLVEMTFDSRRVQAQARLLVLGGADWEHAAPGQRIRATGKLKPPEPGQPEAAVLSASSAPHRLSVPGPWLRGPGELRDRFSAAAGRFDGDARGLLPGMVTGDTSTLDAGLDAAMKSVGMTHLTAVSGVTVCKGGGYEKFDRT